MIIFLIAIGLVVAYLIYTLYRSIVMTKALFREIAEIERQSSRRYARTQKPHLKVIKNEDRI